MLARFEKDELSEQFCFSFFFLRFVIPYIVENGKEKGEARLFSSLLMNLANARDHGDGLLAEWLRKNRLMYKSFSVLMLRKVKKSALDMTYVIPRDRGYRKADATLVWVFSPLFEDSMIRAQEVFVKKLGNGYSWLGDAIEELKKFRK